MRSLPYRPYEEVGDRPHVMVDGAARSGSALVLSHWPQSPTPMDLARDVSAEIVLDYLAAGVDLAPAAEAVTNDHFDVDGAVSVLCLVEPDWALGRAGHLVDIANCGDFAVVASDVSAQAAYAVEPLAAELTGSGATDSECYAAVLARLPEVVDHPERFEGYWSSDLQAIAAGRRAIETGAVTVTERTGLDLAVVERVGGPPCPGAVGGMPVHEGVANSSTSATRVLGFDDGRCELAFRYEGWVRYVSRPVPLRPDLGPLAEQLSAEEPAGVTWEADLVGTIVTRLRPAGEGASDLGRERLRALVEDYLASAPPAWDPFRPGASYIPADEREGYLRRSQRPGGPPDGGRRRRGLLRR